MTQATSKDRTRGKPGRAGKRASKSRPTRKDNRYPSLALLVFSALTLGAGWCVGAYLLGGHLQNEKDWGSSLAAYEKSIFFRRQGIDSLSAQAVKLEQMQDYAEESSLLSTLARANSASTAQTRRIYGLSTLLEPVKALAIKRQSSSTVISDLPFRFQTVPNGGNSVFPMNVRVKTNNGSYISTEDEVANYGDGTRNWALSPEGDILIFSRNGEIVEYNAKVAPQRSVIQRNFPTTDKISISSDSRYICAVSGADGENLYAHHGTYVIDRQAGNELIRLGNFEPEWVEWLPFSHSILTLDNDYDASATPYIKASIFDIDKKEFVAAFQVQGSSIKFARIYLSSSNNGSRSLISIGSETYLYDEAKGELSKTGLGGGHWAWAPDSSRVCSIRPSDGEAPFSDGRYVLRIASLREDPTPMKELELAPLTANSDTVFPEIAQHWSLDGVITCGLSDPSSTQHTILRVELAGSSQ